MSFFAKRPRRTATVTGGLAALERIGIRKRAEIGLEDLLESLEAEPGEQVPYLSLLCLLGSESERDGQPISEDLFYLDTECISGPGDYARVAERMMRLSKSALGISNFTDFVSVQESKAWLKYDFQGVSVHWDIPIESDWIDPVFFPRMAELLRKADPTGPRFLSLDLRGQDILLGYATDDQRRQLNTLNGASFEWLR